MTALNDAEPASPNDRTRGMSEPSPFTPTTAGRTSRLFPSKLPSRWFVAAIVALAGSQLMAMMDGTIAVVALAKIQNELGMSDAERNSMITGYALTFGGFMLLGGRLGDTFGRKRTFIVGVALFTLTSLMCGVAWNGGVLIVARLLQGLAAAIAGPTSIALVATTFPKGPSRNAAMAALGMIGAIGAVTSLVLGGAFAEISWRLAFLVNVPFGLLVIYLAYRTLRETQKERMKLDVTGAVLATTMCTAAVLGFSMAPEKGWLSAPTFITAVVVLGCLVAFIMVERTAENPIVPFSLFSDRSQVATFAAIFLAGGVLFALIVLVALYAQNILGYSGLRVGLGFIPFALAAALGSALSAQLVTRFSPRVVVIGGGLPVLAAVLYGSTLQRGAPYFPNLVVPLVIAALGIGVINVALSLSVIAGVGSDRIGPTAAISMMMQILGGPLLLGVVQVVISSRTLSLGGTTGPVTSMNADQLHAVQQGYAYGLLWLAGFALLFGLVAMFIRYTPQQVARAQEAKKALEAQEP